VLLRKNVLFSTLTVLPLFEKSICLPGVATRKNCLQAQELLVQKLIQICRIRTLIQTIDAHRSRRGNSHLMGDLSKMGMAVLVRHSARHVRLTRKRVAAPVAARREVFHDGSTLGLFKTLDGLGCDSFIARNGR
jgi:hypothetical protein